MGLLCLIHAASNEDVRILSLDDIDLDRATVRLRNRRHPVPLDPLTVDAIRTLVSPERRCLPPGCACADAPDPRTRETEISDNRAGQFPDSRTQRYTRYGLFYYRLFG